MSIQATKWVLRDLDVEMSAGARWVLMALADRADDHGRNSFPSVGTLAKEARMSERNARYCLRQLEALGLIRPTGTSEWGTTKYDLNMQGADSAGGKQATESVVAANEPGRLTAPKPSYVHTPSTTTELLPIENDELAKVMVVLNDVSDAVDAPRTHHTTVAAIINDFPDKDALAVAKKLLTWAQDGGRVKRVGSAYRNWMERERPKKSTAEPQSPQDIRAALTRLRNVGRRA